MQLPLDYDHGRRDTTTLIYGSLNHPSCLFIYVFLLIYKCCTIFVKGDFLLLWLSDFFCFQTMARSREGFYCTVNVVAGCASQWLASGGSTCTVWWVRVWRRAEILSNQLTISWARCWSSSWRPAPWASTRPNWTCSTPSTATVSTAAKVRHCPLFGANCFLW